ncbi:unnamed protein product [Darwinula stevensoni]|uniref:Ubiquitin carboxyl-terminal hydrolase MINDY n=1 Tax=Darwinula stevensoni TaxID=69355 RepID=A0A7R8XAF2_9CRUS|nr:unnamed protein product [Darwinula stevensoni]CAG0883713.1 unnamed protein product [Darwinula stevensoni]
MEAFGTGTATSLDAWAKRRPGSDPGSPHDDRLDRLSVFRGTASEAMQSRPEKEDSQDSLRSKDEKTGDESRSESRSAVRSAGWSESRSASRSESVSSDPSVLKKPGRGRQEAWGKERSNENTWERMLRGGESTTVGSFKDSQEPEREESGRSRDESGHKVWMSMSQDQEEARLEFIDVEDEVEDEEGETREEVRRFTGFEFPEGDPVTPEVAVGLRLLTLGELGKVFPQEWMLQGFFFSDNPSLPFGLVQFKGGPCGVLASVQAHVIKHLETLPNGVFACDSKDREAALAAAMTEILWRAGRGRSASFPEGDPVTPEVAVGLRLLTLGELGKVFPQEWMLQGFFFSDNPSLPFGLVQFKGGPCGVLASVQAHVIKHLETLPNGVFACDSKDREAALAAAMTEILWRAGRGRSASVALPSGKVLFHGLGKFKPDGITEKLVEKRFHHSDEMEKYLRKHRNAFMNRGGCIAFLYSAILSRGIQRRVLGDDAIRDDMDDPKSTLIGVHGYCTQEMVNLFLTGKASSNVFDGNLELGDKPGEKTLLKGISKRAQIGFLSLFEHYNCCKVGESLKNPILPIWVICSESHFSVLFSLSARFQDTTSFDLFYYDGLACQDAPIRLTIGKSSGRSGIHGSEHQGHPPRPALGTRDSHQVGSRFDRLERDRTDLVTNTSPQNRPDRPELPSPLNVIRDRVLHRFNVDEAWSGESRIIGEGEAVREFLGTDAEGRRVHDGGSFKDSQHPEREESGRSRDESGHKVWMSMSQDQEEARLEFIDVEDEVEDEEGGEEVLGVRVPGRADRAAFPAPVQAHVIKYFETLPNGVFALSRKVLFHGLKKFTPDGVTENLVEKRFLHSDEIEKYLRKHRNVFMNRGASNENSWEQMLMGRESTSVESLKDSPDPERGVWEEHGRERAQGLDEHVPGSGGGEIRVHRRGGRRWSSRGSSSRRGSTPWNS